MQDIIIIAPSLDPTQNVSGVSSVAQFIIDNNKEKRYIHFSLGKSDYESGFLNRIKRIYQSYLSWKRCLKTNACAKVHYSFPLSTPSILRDPLFMYYALNKGRKMVIHVHGGLFLTAPKIPIFLKSILKWVFSWNVPFIVLSEGEKSILQERFGAKKVYVLPNCPSLPDNVTLADKDKAAMNSPIILGYLGRIEPNKGMTELLEACKQLKNKGIDFKLRFAGKEQVEGEYLPLYTQSLGESFEYVGLVSGNSKDAFIRSLDMFVMPTYFEGLPMSLLECMGYGVVPIVTPVGSIPDVVRSLIPALPQREGDENGVFINVKDVDSIVEAITMLYDDRTLLECLGRNAQKTINNNFSVERYVEKLNKIYNSI